MMTHEQAWDAIPWQINGTLDDAARECLDAHLVQCAACRAEMSAQRQLSQVMNASPQVEAMPRASLQQLWARIDADPEAPGVTAAPIATSPHNRRNPAWRIAAGLGAVLLVGGAMLFPMLRDSMPRDGYRTVTDPAAPMTGDIRVVFADAMTMEELHALLEAQHLRIVAGPTPSGVYTLAAHGDPAAALSGLRSHPGVRFAEPTGP